MVRRSNSSITAKTTAPAGYQRRGNQTCRTNLSRGDLLCIWYIHFEKLKLSHYTSWRRLGERIYSSYSFSTSSLDGSEWSASRPCLIHFWFHKSRGILATISFASTLPHGVSEVDSTDSRHQVQASCVHYNDTSVSMKGTEFLDQLSDYQLLKKDSNKHRQFLRTVSYSINIVQDIWRKLTITKLYDTFEFLCVMVAPLLRIMEVWSQISVLRRDIQTDIF
jgi:hypothetical protein